MFLCKNCLERGFVNEPSISKSFGECEICKRKEDCSDIPTKNLEWKEINEHYVKFLEMLKKDRGVVSNNSTIDERIEYLKEQLEDMEEAKKEGKTHTVLCEFPSGLHMRLDGDEMLEEQFNIIQIKLK